MADITTATAMRGPRLQLREKPASTCQSCDRPERKEFLEDGICTQTVSVLDGLPVRCVGAWAYDKIYRLIQYFGIFAQGMKDRWDGLNYVEICCGPGRCITRDDRLEIDGTALAIIGHPIFRKLRAALFVDASNRVVDTLNERIKSLGASEIAHAVVGDYEDAPGLGRLLRNLPDRCLNLVFVDPTECSVPFSTVKAVINELGNADLIINVAMGTDVTRNLSAAVTNPSFAKARNKYESFLGQPGFCERADVIKLASRGDHDDLRRLFLERYRAQLAAEGYRYSDPRPVEHYYYLLFASRNPKGLEFWQKACRIDPDNQRQLL